MQPARNFDDVDVASTAYGRRGISRAVARMTAKERAERERALLREMGLERLQPRENWGFIDPKVFAELRDRPTRVKEFGTEALEAIQSGARDYTRLPRSEYSDYTSATAGKAKEYFSNLRKTQPKLYEKLRKEAAETWETPELRRWDRLMSPAARALGVMERVPLKTAGKIYDAIPRQDDRFAIVRNTIGDAAKNLLSGTETGKKVERAAGLAEQAKEIVRTPVGRRGFLQMLGGAGAAMAQKPGETGPAPTDWYKKLAGMLKEEGIDFSLAPMWRLETQTQRKGEGVKPDKWFGRRVQEEKPNLAPYTQYSGDTIHKRAAQFPGAKLQYTFPQRTPSGNIDPEVLTLPAESPFTPERGQAYYDAARKALAGEKPWEDALRKELVQTGVPADTVEKMRLIVQNEFGEGWNIDPAAKFAGTVAQAQNNLVSGNRIVLEEGLGDIRQHLAQRLAAAAQKEAEKKNQAIDNLTKRSNFLRWQDAITHGVSIQNRAPALEQHFLFPANKFRGTPYPKDPRYRQVSRIIKALSGQLDPKIWSKYLRQFD